ncbi:MAG: YihY/virulence factor BrkB family protein [Solirubrobacteraceae bacterium]
MKAPGDRAARVRARHTAHARELAARLRPPTDGRVTRVLRAPAVVRRFWQVAMRANITGDAAMVAYGMLLAIVPIALLALFVAGQVLSSHSVEQSVLNDLREVFPSATTHTLNTLLNQVTRSTTSTGVLALVASLWLGSSFWGSLDTAFSHIYGCRSRPWLEQKRFGLAMLVVVLVFMVATVAVPTVQSVLRAGATDLPFGLDHVSGLLGALSLAVGVVLLFGCLSLIYARVPNRSVSWRGVWPGAFGATIAIGAIDYAFPVYLTNISTIARFDGTIVFVLIVLGWFYVLALIILGGAIVNALRLERPAPLKRGARQVREGGQERAGGGEGGGGADGVARADRLADGDGAAGPDRAGDQDRVVDQAPS